jgi:D-sedoheptulose 7-phosphate isomerase
MCREGWQESGLSARKDRLRSPAPLTISSSKAARAAGMRVVALTGRDGGSIGRSLCDGDIELRVPHASTAHVQEVHILALHCICDAIDQIMFPKEAP